MVWTADSATEIATAADVTEPFWLVMMDFDPAIRFSTAGTIDWDGHSWVAGPIEVDFDDSPTLTIFNESTLIGQTVLVKGTAGRTVCLYQGHYNASGHTVPRLMFIGELGESVIDTYVTIQCKLSPPQYTPRHTVSPPVFNHLPKAGTRIETLSETIILERT